MAQNHRNRTRKSNSVVVGIVAFLLGFLFALIVLVGSIFGIGYVVATTDINKVLSVLGLENKNGDYDADDPDSNKYNYINADKAHNLYELVTEIIAMANGGLGEINLDRIGALAPITDTVLDTGYKFIDGVVDFDKEYFEGVPLTSIIDCVKNSMYYVHTGKIIETVNKEVGTKIDLSEIPIAGYMIDGIEAEYASVSGRGENFRLPVLFDYYVDDGSAIGYGRTIAVDGISAYPDNLKDDLSYIQETTLTNADGKKLYKVFYVPCKVTPTGIEEAEYKTKKITVEDPNVTFSKDGDTVKLKYVFTVLEYGEDTDFIAVKPSDENGTEKFTLNFSDIIASKNTGSSVNASNRYVGYSYYADYARRYYEGPSGRTENDMVFGVTTINNINFFKDNAGNVIEYDPLLVSDLMIDALDTLNHVPVWSVVNASQAKMVQDIFGDTSLGDVLNQNVNFNELIDGLELSSFITGIDPEDQVMSFLVYNISDVKKGANGTYTATYDKNGENIAVTVKVEKGEIVSVKDAEGKTLKGNTVADISNITSDLTLDVFMEIKADDAIMTYLGYGVSDVYEVTGQEYGYVGKYENNETVFIYTDADGVIDRIETETGMVIKGTDINGVSDRVNGVTDVLALPDFIDVDPEESILAYIGYGVYDVEAQTGNNGGKDYQYTATYKNGNDEVTAYIAAEVLDGGGKKVTSVWTDSGNVGGTKINEVSDRIDGITKVLALPDFIDVDPEESILAYIGYGVYDIEAKTGNNDGKEYQYVATYQKDNEEVTAYIASEDLDNGGGKKITSVWTDSGKVSGTKINDISNRLDTITNVLTINEFMDINPSDSIMAYMGYGVTKCEAKPGTDSLDNSYDYICKYTFENGTETDCYIKVNEQGYAESVWYIEGGVKKTVKGTKIGKVPDRISGLQEKLTIGELVTVDKNSSKILQAIQDSTINGLDKCIEQLTVKDVLTEDQINNNSVLPQLVDTKITELGTAIDKVLIQRIYAEKIYGLEKDAQGKVDENPHQVKDGEFNPAYLYYEKDEHGAFVLTEKNCADLTDTDYDNALGKLTQADWDNRGDKVYYTYGEAKGMWKLILYRMPTDGSAKTEKAYTINNFNNMVTACSDTVYNSTLGELKEAGIITGGTDLNKALKAGVNASYEPLYLVISNGELATTTNKEEAAKMQDLTLKQLLDFVSQFIGA